MSDTRHGTTSPMKAAAAAGRFTLRGGREINRMGFGAMRITGPGIWGPPADRAEAVRVLRLAVELGVELIDTADSYGPNVSEELIAEALHPYPPNVLIATKGGLTRPGPGDWRRSARPEHLRAACEGSLKRLRLECIDLYQLHAPDPHVPYEESVGALVELQAAGKIRYIGISNVNTRELRHAQETAAIVSVQNRYNFAEHSSDDVLRECERDGIAFLPWGPLSPHDGSALRRAERIARRHGAHTGQVALAWLLARSTAILPIPGTSSSAHLRENVEAAALRLSAPDLDELAG
ncbi:MAG TPA: aldo/keto reductase [Steroidobacteraceae bacterium]|nr:aldo/keto reductase [Steroidobacteraceae bacterium]